MTARCFVIFFLIVASFLQFIDSECDNNDDENNGEVLVIISFDSLDSASIQFFKNQLAPIYEEFSKCVKWHFVPCSTSRIVNDTLLCYDGTAACQLNVLHACAAHYYESDQYLLGKFFIGMMTDDCQYVKGEGWANEVGLDWNQLKECKPGKQAAEFCDNRFKQLCDRHVDIIPGPFFNWRYNKEVAVAATADLKNQICLKLKAANKQCSACG